MVTIRKLLITSALPYVNNVPHLGNLIGAVLSADVYARYAKSRYGDDNVLYICGSDEHGTTTEIKAKQEGLTPQELCDKYYDIHKDIYDWFGIGFDIFGRTAHETQVKQTQAVFKKLYDNGYIVEDELEQTYDEQAQRFLADRYVEGTCPSCGYDGARGDQCDNCGRMLDPKELVDPISKVTGTKPVIKKVKHLFLDLEKLQPELEAWIRETAEKNGWSQNALNITRGWLKEGLQKRCITRNLEWGVPVPLEGWEDRVFYVWFDAPIGYVSITEQLLGEDYNEWWHDPDNTRLVQFMGKDNIPFHTILFPASLMGTKEPWTMLDTISSTDYLNYEDGKFSKSRQQGVFGDDAKETGVPSDVWRYYLLANRPETSDTTFSWPDFQARLNNELVATLGNLVNRTLVFIKRYNDGAIPKDVNPDEKDGMFWQGVKDKESQATELLEQIRLRDALKAAMDVARDANAYFQQAQPWKAIKEDPAKAKTALYYLAHACRDLAVLLEPYLPATSASVFKQLGIKEQKWDSLGQLDLGGTMIGEPEHLFTKMDDDQLESLRARFSGEQQDEPSEEEKTFQKLDLRVAEITKVEQHPDADKLYIEHLDLGPLGKRQIVSGLKGHYEPEELEGKSIVIVANLKPAKLRGVESQGMLLAGEDGKKVGLLLAPDANPGDQVTAEGLEPDPKSKVDIKEFSAVKLKTKDGQAWLDDKPLTANGKPLEVHRRVEGDVR
ncbi:MAG: methionine--tRNA ligase [Candidatus Woesearchaeota archaeon]